MCENNDPRQTVTVDWPSGSIQTYFSLGPNPNVLLSTDYDVKNIQSQAERDCESR